MAKVNRVLDALLVEQHPDKTFIGRAERGFDFLGYHFAPDGLSVAEKTVERFVERATRLYEQEPGEPCGSSRFGKYVERWWRWVRAGLGVDDVVGSAVFGNARTSAFADSRPSATPQLMRLALV